MHDMNMNWINDERIYVMALQYGKTLFYMPQLFHHKLYLHMLR